MGSEAPLGDTMNCHLVCQRLLHTSGRHRLPEAVETHLRECDRCRRIKQHLEQIDAAVGQISIPSSVAAKTAFIQQFLTAPRPSQRSSAERFAMRKWVLAFGCAAVVVLGIALGSWRHGATPPSSAAPFDPMLERLVELQVELATADDLDHRVKILAQIASNLEEHARRLALVADVDDLRTLAELFAEVVGDKGLSGKVELVPPLNRKVLLEPIAADLMRMASAYEETCQRVPPTRIALFQEMARAARQARDVIRRKLQEEDVARLEPRPVARGGKS